MSFRLVPKSVTVNDLERRNGRYFALFHRIRSFRAHCVKARSQSHLLMSSCPTSWTYRCKNYEVNIKRVQNYANRNRRTCQQRVYKRQPLLNSFQFSLYIYKGGLKMAAECCATLGSVIFEVKLCRSKYIRLGFVICRLQIGQIGLFCLF